MLKNKLSILLAERDLTAAKVHEKTGISRSTLSSLVNNSGDGIQFKTLDNLCNYLEITPADFFDYSPFIFSYFTNVSELTFGIEVTSGTEIKSYRYKIYVSDYDYGLDEDSRIKKYDLYVTASDENTEDLFSKNVYSKLSISMKNDIKEKFAEFVEDGSIFFLNNRKSKIKKNDITVLYKTPFSSFSKEIDLEKIKFEI